MEYAPIFFSYRPSQTKSQTVMKLKYDTKRIGVGSERQNTIPMEIK